MPGVGRAVARNLPVPGLPHSKGTGAQHGTSTQTLVLSPLQQALGCAERHVGTQIGALFTGSWKASLPTYLVNLQYIKDFYRFREGQLYSLKPYFEKIKR